METLKLKYENKILKELNQNFKKKLDDALPLYQKNYILNLNIEYLESELEKSKELIFELIQEKTKLEQLLKEQNAYQETDYHEIVFDDDIIQNNLQISDDIKNMDLEELLQSFMKKT